MQIGLAPPFRNSFLDFAVDGAGSTSKAYVVQ